MRKASLVVVDQGSGLNLKIAKFEITKFEFFFDLLALPLIHPLLRQSHKCQHPIGELASHFG